jgi:hypothetical protein
MSWSVLAALEVAWSTLVVPRPSFVVPLVDEEESSSAIANPHVVRRGRSAAGILNNNVMFMFKYMYKGRKVCMDAARVKSATIKSQFDRIQGLFRDRQRRIPEFRASE